MKYEPIQSPFKLNFENMTRSDLKSYFQWFLEVIPERLCILAQAINTTPNFAIWIPDKTPMSLDILGEWFVMQVKTRLRTEDELKAIKDSCPFPRELSTDEQNELTNQTISLAFDVGMYLSQVFIRNYPTLQWKLNFNKTIDYGQPVLVGFGQTSFNPVRMIIVCAYGVANGERTGKCLREIYEIWVKYISL